MKVCKKDGCINPVFSKGYCRNHQWLRTDKKSKVLKRTPLKKVSKKQRVILGEKRKLTKRDQEFFFSIWEDREHVCFESGEWLGHDPLTLYFHHCLPKSIYPQFRYCKWNILLLTWENHSKAETNTDFVPKVKEYTAFLKQKILK